MFLWVGLHVSTVSIESPRGHQMIYLQLGLKAFANSHMGAGNQFTSLARGARALSH